MKRIGFIASNIEELEIWSRVLYLNKVAWIFEREEIDGEEVFTIYTQGKDNLKEKLLSEFKNLVDLTTNVNLKF